MTNTQIQFKFKVGDRVATTYREQPVIAAIAERYYLPKVNKIEYLIRFNKSDIQRFSYNQARRFEDELTRA